MSKRQRLSRLQALDRRVMDGNARRWFMAVLALTLVAAMTVAVLTQSLLETMAALVTPALIVLGCWLGMRWRTRE